MSKSVSESINATPRAFSSGSVGVHANGKLTLPVGEDGELVTFQVSASFTALGTKPGSKADVGDKGRAALLAKLQSMRWSTALEAR